MTGRAGQPVRPTRADFELFERVCTRPTGCGARILWAKTAASGGVEWMPIDVNPVDTGNVLPYLDPDNPRRLLVAVYDVRKDRRRLAGMVADGWLLFQHHRLSCPRAEQWARGPKSVRPQPTGFCPAPAAAHDEEPEGLF